ncbi:RNA 2',3'-cyclic phosphodiesterase [Idiomarina tyrosinivorans]|uniref:RNA 2',3'-cyclic phosphodiesterase n=1 Tax=Idiomarina tyrosinivorans TaxID=1445662 RepID=A0A432ZRY7_9GAMM|nr:RNA 2',3'-cyclic phosphodiesterase [Idiomarina tyrosinivorans]RUO80674.1 RNA 2',3'-cyclic phosphodiesterase [Idiomarina tyrosinivorans]
MSDHTKTTQRLFLGLDLLTPEKQALADWQYRHLNHPRHAVYWGNYHLTLGFFGACTQQQRDALVERISNVERPTLTSQFGLLGYWPESRTVYLAPSQPNASLNAFAGQLRQHLAINDERPFAPHISLIRGAKEPAQMMGNPANFRIRWTALTLFWSKPTEQGVRYQPLARWPLPLR